jgi:hypothetical protein
VLERELLHVRRVGADDTHAEHDLEHVVHRERVDALVAGAPKQVGGLLDPRATSSGITAMSGAPFAFHSRCRRPSSVVTRWTRYAPFGVGIWSGRFSRPSPSMTSSSPSRWHRPLDRAGDAGGAGPRSLASSSRHERDAMALVPCSVECLSHLAEEARDRVRRRPGSARLQSTERALRRWATGG